jgi:hypothetical protein
MTMPYRDPEQRREYDREYKRTARTGGGPTPGQTRVPLPFRLKTAADVLALLEEQVGAVRGDDTLTTVERARTVGYLAGVALKAIEAGDLAARVEAVEAVLKGRRAS